MTGLYVAELDSERQIVRLVLHKEYDKKTTSEIVNDMFSVHVQIPNTQQFVDGVNREAVNEFRSHYDEDLQWIKAEDINIEENCVIPVNFGRVQTNVTAPLSTTHRTKVGN